MITSIDAEKAFDKKSISIHDFRKKQRIKEIYS